MNRLHLFEFTDQPWYPPLFRRLQTDYLQFVASLSSSGTRQLVPLLVKAMQHAGTSQIVDLCSGSAGPWLRLRAQLAEAGFPVTVTLTDKFPQPAALEKWPAAARSGIAYQPEPVDAAQVPAHLNGMRTLFEGFHHFPPALARLILQSACDQNMPIGVFEISLKAPFGWLILLLSPLMTLAAYLLLTPFIRPRTFARFFWTYLLPLVPLATCWDGIVSLLRVYSPQELDALTAPLQRPGYRWETSRLSTGTPIFDYTYLLGFPLP